MKNAFILFILLTTLTTYAQHKAVQFGFGGGVNMGWFATNTDEYTNNGLKAGGSWGFVTDIYLMEGYTFTTGFNVVYLNGNLSMPYQLDSLEGNIQRAFKTKYLEIPLSLTMKTKKIKDKVRFYGQIGLGISFLLTARGQDDFTSVEGTKLSDTKNIYDDLTATRESLILGLGIEIPVNGSSFIRTGFRFDNAFINILKGNNSLDPSIKNNGRNNFVEFMAAFLF